MTQRPPGQDHDHESRTAPESDSSTTEPTPGTEPTEQFGYSEEAPVSVPLDYGRAPVPAPPVPAPAFASDGPSNRSRLITTIVAAVVVLIGAAGSVWWFTGRSTAPSALTAPNPPSSSHRPPTRTATPTTVDNSAYGVGTCLIEPADATTSGLQLTPVPCDGTDAVLTINQVVPQYSDCQASSDYINHGFVLTDVAANVYYCLSLVVPVNQCFEFSTDNSQPIQRAACGSAPNVVQVESIESAASASSACSDKAEPDIWFYQSPTSGQFECVSSQPPSTQTAPDTQTTTPLPPTSG